MNLRNDVYGSTFYYVLNTQGDVTGMTNSEGKLVIAYTYDAWGRMMYYIEDADWSNVLAATNPLLYRGYLYDIEIGLYYLQSRYYDMNTHRFLNADAFAATGQGLLGNNMFAYCGNNPVNCSDCSGMFWAEVWCGIKEVIDTAVQCTVFNHNPVGSIIIMVVHYNRNTHNVVYQTESEAINAGYVQVGKSDDKFHQNNQKNGRNKKYISDDGHYEAVYYSNGQLNETPEDEGTYNFFSSSGNAVERYVGHLSIDVVPYMIWGNSLTDSTTIIDRIIMIFK